MRLFLVGLIISVLLALGTALALNAAGLIKQSEAKTYILAIRGGGR
jgi:hypothetical protein